MPHANLTHAEAQTRARLIGDVSYDVELDLTTEGPTFPSRTTARFTAEPGASTFVDLQAEQVRSATLNGAVLPIVHQWKGNRSRRRLDFHRRRKRHCI